MNCFHRSHCVLLTALEPCLGPMDWRLNMCVLTFECMFTKASIKKEVLKITIDCKSLFRNRRLHLYPCC